MPLTAPGDLYVGFSDAGFAKLVNAARQQRPSLFTYATPYFAQHPELWCVSVTPPPNGAPTYSPLPAVSHYPIDAVPSIEYVVQFADVALAFGVDTVGLPASLLPLPTQHAALKVRISARVQIPRLDPSTIGPPGANQFAQAQFKPELVSCFDVELAATLFTTFKSSGSDIWLALLVDGFDENLVEPQGLKEFVERVVLLILDTKVLPNAWPKLQPYVIDLTKSLPPDAPIKTVTLMLNPTAVASNPSIDADVFSAKFDMTVSAP